MIFGRRKKFKPPIDIPEKTDTEKADIFVRIGRLAAIEAEKKAARQAEAEAWIAEVKARKPKKETA